jgi:hypothetical protein
MGMSETKEPLESDVKKEIEKTGLPTEIRATEALNNEGWMVFNEYPYLDIDENKIRTLDIVANKSFMRINNNQEKEFDFEYTLYIECKKASKHSWVFFTQASPLPFIWLSIDQLAYAVTKGTFNRTIEVLEESNKELTVEVTGMSVFSRIPVQLESLSYKIALSQQSVFNNKGARDDFYEALMQVLKTLSDKERNVESGKDSKIRVKDRIVPIIIFDGFLFECFFEKENLKISKIDYTRYLAHGLPNQRLPALIDVMTADYFPTYLKKLNEELVSKKEQK